LRPAPRDAIREILLDLALEPSVGAFADLHRRGELVLLDEPVDVHLREVDASVAQILERD